jgi:hypothetical protein
MNEALPKPELTLHHKGTLGLYLLVIVYVGYTDNGDRYTVTDEYYNFGDRQEFRRRVKE